MATGIQFVDPTLGSDLNDGASWGSAKATIEAAIAALPQSWPAPGGTIHLSGGRHIVNGLTIALANVTIRGAGRGATVLVPQGDYGLRISSSFVTVENCQFAVQAAKGDAPFYGRAVWIESDRNATIRDVWFHQLSKDYSGSDDIDLAPAAIWVGGTNGKFSDWHVFDGLSIWGCYRGLVGAGSHNFMVTNSDISTVKEGLYSYRRVLSEGGGGTVHAFNVWFTGGDDYLVRLDWDADSAPNPSAGVSFTSCNFEPGQQAGVDSGHVYCNLRQTRFVGCKFTGGSHSADPTPHAIYFGDDAGGCTVHAYVATGGGLGIPSFYGNVAGQVISP